MPIKLNVMNIIYTVDVSYYVLRCHLTYFIFSSDLFRKHDILQRDFHLRQYVVIVNNITL